MFIRNRSIHENIRIVQKLAYSIHQYKASFHSIHQYKPPNPIILIKIAPRKAFDRLITLTLNYSTFLILSLSGFRFVSNPLPFLALLMRVRLLTSRVVSESCKVSNPLYLYVIMANIISTLLNEAIKHKRITPYNIKGKCIISHLMYSDDIMLCLDERKTCSNLK